MVDYGWEGLSPEERAELYNTRVKAIRRIVGEVVESIKADEDLGVSVSAIHNGQVQRAWLICERDGMAIASLGDLSLFDVCFTESRPPESGDIWGVSREVVLRYVDKDNLIVNCREDNPDGFSCFGGFYADIGPASWEKIGLISGVLVNTAIECGLLSEPLTGIFARI